MMQIRFNKRGQVSPLFIIIIVILIIALLVTINIAKVSTSKINTANAADAGALAAGSQWSCALNYAGLVSTIDMAIYLYTQICLLKKKFITAYVSREKKCIKMGKVTRRLYISAQKSVAESNKLAPMEAYHYAFINAGIDDQRKWDPNTKTYRRKYNPNIETWRQWLTLKYAFSEWLNDIGYPEQNDYPDQYHYPEENYYLRHSLRYKWNNRGTTEDEKLGIQIGRGVEPETSRLLLPLIGIYYMCLPCPPCFPFPVCPVCPESGKSPCEISGIPIPFTYEFVFPLPHNIFSPTPGFMYAGIISIKKRPWIAVTVIHEEPEENLGLWQVKKTSTKSSSYGKVYKGSVLPLVWIFDTFDLKITNTDFN